NLAAAGILKSDALDAIQEAISKRQSGAPPTPPPSPGQMLERWSVPDVAVSFTAPPQNGSFSVTDTISLSGCCRKPATDARAVSITTSGGIQEARTVMFSFSAQNPVALANHGFSVNGAPSGMITINIGYVPGTPPQLAVTTTTSGGITGVTA